MSVINTIKDTARKVIKEGYKQYPEGMSRQEYLELKSKIEKELEMNEAVEVNKANYSWGKMITVHHGASHSYPLHPEHQKKIAALKDGEKTTFKDETKTNVTAHRDGDTIHLSADTHGSTKTPVARSHFTEELEGNQHKIDANKNNKIDAHDFKLLRKSKKDVDLDEGRGRPPKVGSAAYIRAQAAKSGDEGETQEADKNIHTQLHKVISAKKPVTFNNGKTHEISSAHAHKALALLQNSKPSERLALQHSLSHSHDRFHETIKTGKAVSEPAKPKITLAKKVMEAATSDKKGLIVFKKRDKDGVLRIHTRRGESSAKNILEATKTVDVDTTPHITAKLDKTNMAADSMKKYEKDPLFSKVKFKLPPTQGNKPIGGEDQVHVGKFSMAEERSLNSLYSNLSEENKELFKDIIKTEEGIAGLVKFAIEQGY